MTRAKADSDPWLTDMVSRDREIAKTVVYGIREIIQLLRGIRDDLNQERASLLRENARLRDEISEAYREHAGRDSVRPVTFDKRGPGFVSCEAHGCPLPMGHDEPHRGSLAAAHRT